MSTVSLEFGSTLADGLAKTVAADARLADAAAVIAACAEAAVDVSEVIGRGMLGGADLAATGDHNRQLSVTASRSPRVGCRDPCFVRTHSVCTPFTSVLLTSGDQRPVPDHRDPPDILSARPV